MTEQDVKQVEKYLEFIEDKGNYYAYFSHVVKAIDATVYLSNRLFQEGLIDLAKRMSIAYRLEQAKGKAICTNLQWIVNRQAERKEPLPQEALIYTIYNNIFDTAFTPELVAAVLKDGGADV